ncbi:hypothetical protein [Bacillus toyonensis]|uniref:hypothetical protein n=1 Tax=Bacillus toyonensis TaxID=155322 RepID=UPI003D64A766
MMKVFKMNDFDWVYAETEKQAKEYYKNECGFDDEDINEGFVCEVSLQDTMHVDIDGLSEGELKKLQVGIPIGDTIFIHKTFEWAIKHENITSPCFIASTGY